MARSGSSGEACGLVRAGTTTASGDTSRRQVPRRSMIATHTILQSRYRIDDLIDRGGMADVYRGRDVRLERDVAVKGVREVGPQPRFAAQGPTLGAPPHPNPAPPPAAGS